MRSTGQAGLVQRDVPDDLRERDRRDRQVIGQQAKRREPDQQTEQHRRADRQERGGPQRQVALDHQDRHRVRGDRHERRVAEIQQARVAELQLQAQGEDRVDPCLDPDERPEGGVEELRHSSRAFPNRPCGRTSRTTIRVTKATTGL